jgi:hypothetical protein
MLQLWHDLVPTLVGGIGGVLGLHAADAFLLRRRPARRRTRD